MRLSTPLGPRYQLGAGPSPSNRAELLVAMCSLACGVFFCMLASDVELAAWFLVLKFLERVHTISIALFAAFTLWFVDWSYVGVPLH